VSDVAFVVAPSETSTSESIAMDIWVECDQ
jgi:hypothetical protein